jgi:hypothetical protein
MIRWISLHHLLSNAIWASVRLAERLLIRFPKVGVADHRNKDDQSYTCLEDLDRYAHQH